MALEIIWSKKADERFDSIIENIENQWGSIVTSKFVRKIFNFLEILSEFPEIGTIENIELNIRGFVIVKQLTLFYQIREEQIIILNFYDNRQKPKTKKY
jgi:plasmid stabilization system protein ParE